MASPLANAVPLATAPVITVSPEPPMVNVRPELASLVMFTAPKVSFLPLAMVFPMARFWAVLPVTVPVMVISCDPWNTTPLLPGWVCKRTLFESVRPAFRASTRPVLRVSVPLARPPLLALSSCNTVGKRPPLPPWSVVAPAELLEPASLKVPPVTDVVPL